MPSVFTRYQKLVIAILSFLQFTIILDFMILSPLGATLLQELHVTTSQFSLVVSVYAFSAGASGLLTAGFADKFDRKKLLLFFYAGFIVGTAVGQPNIAAGVGFYGAGIAIYERLLRRGKEVSFARDTRIVLQTTARRGATLKPDTQAPRQR